jgi:hypothetical protein
MQGNFYTLHSIPQESVGKSPYALFISRLLATIAQAYYKCQYCVILWDCGTARLLHLSFFEDILVVGALSFQASSCFSVTLRSLS